MFVSEYATGEVAQDVKTENLWLMLGDCLERMKEIPDGSVDMVLCDLPYGTTACKWDALIPFEPLWQQYRRVCKPNAAILLFGAQPFTSLLVCSNLKWFKYQYVWVKNTQTGIALAKTQPMRKHEDVCVFYNQTPTFNKQMVETESAIMLNHSAKGYGRGEKLTKTEHLPGMQLQRTPFSRMINPNTVLKFDVVPNRSKSKTHPTEKPVSLLEHLVKTYTDSGQVVLDNTMGTGSTGVACMNLVRGFIGIEMDGGYFDVAKQRILAARQ